MESMLSAGKYEIVRTIGKGGTGTVYLVTDRNLQMFRAMKEIAYNGADAAWKKKSLEAEIDVLKRAEHPMLPRIVDLFHTQDASYIILEYIDGVTLEDYMRQGGKVTQEQAVAWGIALADVSDYLHRLQPPVLYLDMKPSNIMLRKDGTLKLIDFGAAFTGWREQEQSQYMGTPGYAAPEQTESGSVDVRTDIYALGATLYHLVTGVSPALQKHEIRNVREWDITISPALEKVITRAMSQKPKERFSSASEMAEALQNVHNRKWRDLFLAKRTVRKNFIICHKKNLIYTEKESVGLDFT